MLTYREAQGILIGMAKSFGTETVALEQALGRVLAEPVIADRDYPPFNRATMDGYAIHSADLQKDILEFIVAETIFAGQVSTTSLASGECYKIMTGASVPTFADLVIRREDIIEKDGFMMVQPGQYPAFQHIARQGEDVKAGERIIGPSVWCTPAMISVLAALGKASVVVEKLPRVSLFTTGNEVVAVEKPVTAVQIRNSNSYLLKSLLQKWGVTPFLSEHIRDDKNELYNIFQQGIKGDIIIISGGVSAGDADYVPEILASLGVIKLFHKVAIKPGKPMWCGYFPNGAMVFALPGNPFSSLVTFTLFVEIFLSHCFGCGDPGIRTLPFMGHRSKKSDVDEFFPVSLQESPFGALPVSFNGSGDILAALFADGIAEHPSAINTLSPLASVSFRSFKK
ncbi:MAG: molybdopterin molybdotransferase MoeA [Chitinophagaceae bacterium]